MQNCTVVLNALT